MKQYLLCPKCRHRLAKYGPEKYACTYCRTLYGVAKKRQYTMRFLNFVIMVGAFAGLTVALANSF